METIELGDIAVDTVTGYEGVVIIRGAWENNCDRITLQRQGLKDGEPYKTASFDEPKVRVVRKNALTPTPTRRASPPVQLGDEVRDRLTGLEGRAIGLSFHFSGCLHVCIQPKALKPDGTPADSKWSDEVECEITKPVEVPKARVQTGGPRKDYAR